MADKLQRDLAETTTEEASAFYTVLDAMLAAYGARHGVLPPDIECRRDAKGGVLARIVPHGPGRPGVPALTCTTLGALRWLAIAGDLAPEHATVVMLKVPGKGTGIFVTRRPAGQTCRN